MQVMLHKKWSLLFRIFLVNANVLQNTANLFTFTKEIFNEKIRFLCSGNDGFVNIY